MGKNNKKRKRAKHALFHAVKADRNRQEGTSRLVPPNDDTEPDDDNDDDDNNDNNQDTNDTITDRALATTLETLQTLVSKNPLVFHSKRYKDLRRILHPLVMQQMALYNSSSNNNKNNKGMDYRSVVTRALQHQQWSDALLALQACRDFQQVPKPGTVQRWVRDCMAATTTTTTTSTRVGKKNDDHDNNNDNDDASTSCRQFQILQAILNVDAMNHHNNNNNNYHGTNKHDPGQAMAEHLASNYNNNYNTGIKDNLTILEGWKWWEDTQEKGKKEEEEEEEEEEESNAKKTPVAMEEDNKKESAGPEATATTTTTTTIRTKLQSRILYREAAAERTPPNHYDLLLHTTQPGSIVWSDSKNPPPTAAHAVPFLPCPARVLSDVLTANECRQIINVMTTLGYRPDHPVSLSQPTGIDSCEWMVDAEIAAKLLERIQPHVPSTLTVNHNKTVQLHSINARWRGFRYGQGCVYRPHLDGSWPLCFIDDKSGDYVCPNPTTTTTTTTTTTSQVKSYLTFLIYLNDDFQGGETRFYLPYGRARGIVPKTGSVAVFPQGNMASLIHEGSPVTRGTKYVVRTDVLYRPM